MVFKQHTISKLALPIFIASTILLVLAKIIPFYHLNYSDFYVDIDRAVALFFFLWAYHALYVRAFSIKPYIALFGAAIVFLAVVVFSSSGLSIQKAIMIFFLTAFVEEILARGILLSIASHWLGKYKAVLATSILFTLVHPNVYANYTYGLAVFALGILLGVVFLSFQERAYGVVASTFIHALVVLVGFKVGLL